LTQKEELAFYREQEQITHAEQERRDIIAKEEKRLTDQRRKYVHTIFIQPRYS